MKEQVVNLKTAKLAKSKRFNIETNTVDYMLNGNYIGERGACISCTKYVPAPTQSLLQKWLREEKNIVVEVNFNDSLFRRLHEAAHKKISLNYHWVIFTNTPDPQFIYNKFYSDDTFETYEEALEQCLQKALKMINL